MGLLGLLYWYALYPLHSPVFAGMLRGIVRALEKETSSEDPNFRTGRERALPVGLGTRA